MARISRTGRREVSERFGAWLSLAMQRSGVSTYRLRLSFAQPDDGIGSSSLGGRRLHAILEGRAAVTPGVAVKLSIAAGASVIEGLWFSYPALAIRAIDNDRGNGNDPRPERRWIPGDDVDAWARATIAEPEGRSAATLYAAFFQRDGSDESSEQERLVGAIWRALASNENDEAREANDRAASYLKQKKLPELFEPRLRVAASILGALDLDWGLRRVTTLPLVRAAARSWAAGLFDDALIGWSERSTAPSSLGSIMAEKMAENPESHRF